MHPDTRSKRLLVVIWAAFVARGAFYCVQQPMWEGFDEWAHFAYVEHLAETGDIPRRTDAVPADVSESLQLAPLSRSAARAVAGSITHEEFWRLPEDAREQRQVRIRTAGAAGAGRMNDALQYEAQQPPLYYALLSLPYRAVRTRSLPARVLTLRLVSVLIASSVLFTLYGLTLQLLPRGGFPILLPVLVSSLPGLLINICRVSNESLSIALWSVALLLMMRVTRDAGNVRLWAGLGVVLGAALLTKAYTLALLPLLPAIAALSLIRMRRQWRRVLAGMLFALALAAAVSGWFYRRSWVSTGTLSGEQLDVAASAGAAGAKVDAVTAVNWRSVIDTAAFTHIWVGGWSFLTARAWMYRVCEAMAAMAFCGVIIFLVRDSGCFRRAGFGMNAHGARVVIVLGFYLSLCAAVAYHALVAYMAYGISTALGWYLYAAITAEALLIAVGFIAAVGVRNARIAVAGICLLACALDLYTTQFLLTPFYSGVAGRRLHDDPMLMFSRLAVNEPACITPEIVAAAWAGYLAATLLLAAMAVWTAQAARAEA